MRLRLTIKRHDLADAKIWWETWNETPKPTVASLLSNLNEVFPLDLGNRGLEDYVVEYVGHELLHFQKLEELVADGDELLIRPLVGMEIRERKRAGRRQISEDGKKIIDGTPFGRTSVKRAMHRPVVDGAPRKRQRINDTRALTLFQAEEDEDDEENDEDFVPDEFEASENSEVELEAEEEGVMEQADGTEGEDDLEDFVTEYSPQQWKRPSSRRKKHVSEPAEKRKRTRSGVKGNPMTPEKAHASTITHLPEKPTLRKRSTPEKATPEKVVHFSKTAKLVQYNDEEGESDNDDILPEDEMSSDSSSGSESDLSASNSSKSPDDSSSEEDEVSNGPRSRSGSVSSLASSASAPLSESEEQNEPRGESTSKNKQGVSNATCTPGIPFQGSPSTKSRNTRAKRSRAAKKARLIGAGLLPADATDTDLTIWLQSHPGDINQYLKPKEAVVSPAGTISKAARRKLNKLIKAGELREGATQADLTEWQKVHPEGFKGFFRTREVAQASQAQKQLKETTADQEETESGAATSLSKSARGQAAKLSKQSQGSTKPGQVSGPSGQEADNEDEGNGEKIPQQVDSVGAKQPQVIREQPPVIQVKSKRLRIDRSVAERLISRHIGVPAPTNEEENLKRQWVKNHARSATNKKKGFLKKMAGVNPKHGKYDEEGNFMEVTSNAIQQPEDDAWKERIILSAVECEYEGMEVPQPNFPFEQPKVPVPSGGNKRKRETDGKQWKDKRNKTWGSQNYHYEDYDQYNNEYNDDWATHDYYDDTTAVELPSSNNTNRQKQEEEFLPPLPSDLSTLEDLKKPVLLGTIVAFKELTMDKNYNPIVADYKTALVEAVEEDDLLVMKLAVRDRPERRYNEETGERLYNKFEMPKDSDDDEGIIELTFGDLIEPKVVSLPKQKDKDDTKPKSGAIAFEQQNDSNNLTEVNKRGHEKSNSSKGNMSPTSDKTIDGVEGVYGANGKSTNDGEIDRITMESSIETLCVDSSVDSPLSQSNTKPQMSVSTLNNEQRSQSVNKAQNIILGVFGGLDGVVQEMQRRESMEKNSRQDNSKDVHNWPKADTKMPGTSHPQKDVHKLASTKSSLNTFTEAQNAFSRILDDKPLSPDDPKAFWKTTPPEKLPPRDGINILRNVLNNESARLAAPENAVTQKPACSLAINETGRTSSTPKAPEKKVKTPSVSIPALATPIHQGPSTEKGRDNAANGFEEKPLPSTAPPTTTSTLAEIRQAFDEPPPPSTAPEVGEDTTDVYERSIRRLSTASYGSDLLPLEEILSQRPTCSASFKVKEEPMEETSSPSKTPRKHNDDKQDAGAQLLKEACSSIKKEKGQTTISNSPIARSGGDPYVIDLTLSESEEDDSRKKVIGRTTEGKSVLGSQGGSDGKKWRAVSSSSPTLGTGNKGKGK